jgi:pimeloyl-ACP methyl ester carboxylesterase
MADTSAHGIRIAYDDQGAGEPALLLLTGWCSSKERWSAVARLCAERRRVLSTEWRGHGSSERPAGDFGLEEMVEDAIAVADAAGVEQFVPCAASHAGFVAIELRRRFPERVPMLVHVDWYVIPPPPPYRAVLELLTSPDDWPVARDKLIEIWRAGLDRPEIDAALDVMLQPDAAMWMRSGREIMAGYARVGSPTDAWAGLDPPVPVLHAYGQPADPAFLAAQEAFAEEHPWFSVRKLTSVSHFAMLEEPQQVAAVIDEFVAHALARRA